MEYNTSLFGCFNDLESCLLGTFCTPCLAASNHEIGVMGHRAVYCTDCLFPNPYYTRQAIHDGYGMKKQPLTDCLSIYCCMPCAVCQDSRELMGRGLLLRNQLCSCSCDQMANEPVGAPRIVFPNSAAPTNTQPMYY